METAKVSLGLEGDKATTFCRYPFQSAHLRALGSHCVTRTYLTLNQADPEKRATYLGGVIRNATLHYASA